MFKRYLLLVSLIIVSVGGFAQKRKKHATPPPAPIVAPPPAPAAPKSPVKPYKEVITDKAKTTKGLFIVHKIEDKWYFELPDSLFNRDIMAITRFSKVATGVGYGGELANQQVIRWEKGPNNNVFLRVITVVNIAQDSASPISQAVRNSNVDPIGAAFDIKAFSKDSAGVVIEVTDFFKGDNQIVSLSPDSKRKFNLSGLMPDRSYIDTIKSFPINTEVRTVKTFGAAPGGAPSPFGPPSGGSPAAAAAGVVTIELNNSFILLPVVPMHKRLFDPRVGYFADDYTVYSDDQQKVQNDVFAVRWRLEPKEEDMERWKRGELVEPKKPIIYYIDPATPKKWRPYLIQGINDWQAAFEQAGFKNAIMAKEWPARDSGMSLEDARYSVLRYFASDVENAYGPNIHDPRSGEIIESHIGWYHNVMKLLHDWYFVQAAAVDPRARKMKFDDSLMGELIRFVSSHEIGHTLGLRHNMGASNATPVEKLRDKNWIAKYGHTVSIMDYARFNYVAQPEDGIKDLFPRISVYDKWAIEWGYKYLPSSLSNEEEKKTLNKWILSHANDPMYWFGGEGMNNDPRAQAECLGDNNMKASEYGIKNLKRVMSHLVEWTKEEGDPYENLEEMYTQVYGQFNRYIGHVLKNIGGIYETIKTYDQKGDVYTPAPKTMQREAVQFVNRQVFVTPTWLLDKNVLNKISEPSSDKYSSMLDGVIGSILNPSRLSRMVASSDRDGNAYSIEELYTDLKKGVWGELATHTSISSYRRDLQKSYVAKMTALVGGASQPAGGMIIMMGGGSAGGDPSRSDISSLTRAYLQKLRAEILAAAPLMKDSMSRYHLQDLAERIHVALDPRK